MGIISFNDGLIWFCEEGGCTTMPQDFAWVSVFLIALAFLVGFFVGRGK